MTEISLTVDPLARCFAEGVEAAIARFEIPPYAGSAVIKAKLNFPGGTQKR